MPKSPIFRIAFAASALVALVAVLALWAAARLVFKLDGSDGSAFQATVLAVGVCALAAAYALSSILARRVGSDLARLTATADSISRGDYSPAGGSPAGADMAALAASVQRIGGEMQPRLTSLEVELHGLKAILGAMEEGLVVVDSDKRVRMANLAARKMLNFPDGELINRPLQEVTRLPDLLGNIELCLTASQTCSFELQMTGATGGKGHILARCSPFQDASHSISGAMAVLHDITELRRLERVRTEFVANVSHELRTPLTSLLGYLETLQEGGYADPEQLQRFLLVCRRQAERLSRIVEDLLRLSRLENPQQEIAAAEVDLTEVVGTAVEQCRPLAEERGVELAVELPSQTATVWGDRGLLVQAISNLTENAIHYNREKGRVQVRLARFPSATSPNWEISVADTGIGIPRDSIGRIFERFYRVDKARSRERGGTGLGLSIVRHIALAHGASVHVESEVDRGSTFFLRFKGRGIPSLALLAS